MEIHACTIIARNYLAHARVLASSFRAQHPEARFTVLVTDDRFGEVTGDGEPFEVMQLGALDIEQATLHQMIMGYGVMELATAVKPWLLRTLLTRGSGVVAYFDPDIFVYQPVDDLFETASSHGIDCSSWTILSSRSMMTCVRSMAVGRSDPSPGWNGLSRKLSSRRRVTTTTVMHPIIIACTITGSPLSAKKST